MFAVRFDEVFVHQHRDEGGGNCRRPRQAQKAACIMQLSKFAAFDRDALLEYVLLCGRTVTGENFELSSGGGRRLPIVKH